MLENQIPTKDIISFSCFEIIVDEQKYTLDWNSNYVKYTTINKKGNYYIEFPNFIAMLPLDEFNVAFLISNESLKNIKLYTWFLEINNNYISTMIDKQMIKLHNYLLQISNSNQTITHINKNTLDNRLNNLMINE